MTTQQDAGPALDPRAAVAELGRGSSEGASMESVLQRVAALAKQVVPSVAEASVTVIADGRPSTAAYTGRLALDLDEMQYGRGHGPCLEAAAGEGIREITDARVETRWPDYTPMVVDRGVLSSLSVPVPILEGLHGGLNFYAARAGAFDADVRARATTFGSYAAVAAHNAHLSASTRELADDPDPALRTRSLIEQAKGIVMCQRHCDAARALDLLVAASRRSNRRLRHVAQSVVDGVSGHDSQPG